MGKKRILLLVIAPLFLFFSLNSFAQTCGDQQCESGENSCTCPADCGSCEGNVPGQSCKSYICQENICSIISVAGCCGNGSCEDGENYGNCPSDCTPENVEIEILSPIGEKFSRGEEVLIKLKVTADGRSAPSTKLSTTGDFEGIVFFNDGEHNDELAADSVFSGKISILKQMEAGIKKIDIKAEFLGIKSSTQLDLEVDPTLKIKTNIKSEIELGQNIEITGQILKKEKPAQADLNINLFIDEVKVFSKISKTDENGFFDTFYHSSLLDRIGNWELVITAADEFNNRLIFERTINVKKPEKIDPLNIESISNFKELYLQGEEIEFTLVLVNDKQELVKEAEVFLTLPNNEQVTLVETEPGTYARSVKILRDFKEGIHTFKIEAKVIENELQIKAEKRIIIRIESQKLKIEVIEPTNLSYNIGEKMELKLQITDFEDKPVDNAEVKALINEQEVFFELTKRGEYTAHYEIQPSDEGEIKIDFSAIDIAGNKGLKNLTIRVGGKEFFYDIFQNILVFGVVIVVILVIGVGLLVFIRSFRGKKSLEKKLRNLEEMEKKAQERYFHEHSITKEEYQKHLERYESEIKKIKNQLQEK